MSGVICAGNIVIDLLVRPVDAEIRWNATKWVDSLEFSIGGNGANTASAIAGLDVRVRLLGAVGNDAFAAMALERLTQAGVDTSHVERLELPTAATVALVREDGARAFLHRGGLSREFFAELPSWDPAGFSRFHLGNPFGMVHLRKQSPAMLRTARESGLITSMDAGWDSRSEWMTVVGPCLPFVDWLFLNEEESRFLSGTHDFREAARLLRQRGVLNVVVKLGARGCWISSPDAEWHQPGFVVDVIDTTGAGDCFAGGFLAALEHNLDATTAARVANACGALSVQALGSVAGLRDWDGTLAWMSDAVELRDRLT